MPVCVSGPGERKAGHMDVGEGRQTDHSVVIQRVRCLCLPPCRSWGRRKGSVGNVQWDQWDQWSEDERNAPITPHSSILDRAIRREAKEAFHSVLIGMCLRASTATRRTYHDICYMRLPVHTVRTFPEYPTITPEPAAVTRAYCDAGTTTSDVIGLALYATCRRITIGNLLGPQSTECGRRELLNWD
ncbi:uncharacterized protein K489DRAFT_145250 [Dissoconium aciculare CBS 342.82]|uniref:Uncharacterized protein n=1 Tax=Dissoconium aciculare CBS 342.82 TaxID=1314786 RepID=A0A6J3MAP4_9PEZI|nr:uncharacterized protein K489DRAFT_145250 [Dissoconium aciculare CBS 342.82]KAF1824933.1 hypothetical protein K489DRAFT_145250 [Dissoconium aciculare CBS 342.82]